MSTCDTCKHYTPTRWPHEKRYENAGECALMEDDNSRNEIDKVSPWGEYGDGAWCHVGPKFGCIHWATATLDPSPDSKLPD